MARAVNPYIAGKPLPGERGFFGRQDTLDWVISQLRNPGTNSLVLFGQRRIGKTSLLLQLKRILVRSEFLPVYFDLQDQATAPLGRVLADLADTILGEAGLEFSGNIDTDDSGKFFRQEFLPIFLGRLPANQRVVLLFDEFDVIDQASESELPANVAAKSLHPLLRLIMNQDSPLAFVFVAGRRPEDLSLDFAATFKTSLTRELWVLDLEGAVKLIRQAEENKTLRYTDQAVDRILALTNRHPYLTQLLCQRIWDRAHNTEKPWGNAEIPVIEMSDVEAAIPSALEAGGQVLDWLWRGLSPAERVYAAAFAEIAGDEPISEDKVVEVLSSYAARLRRREVELAPQDLIKRKVIEKSGDQYVFAVELFRRWIRQNRPVQSIKDELDRVDQAADHLFRAGERKYVEKKWGEAIGHFADTLQENPLHFRAQLYMGESLLHLDRTTEAIEALEKAYHLDRDESRLPLARAWMSRAKELHQQNDDDSALIACEKALELSPNESSAKELKSLIWNQRGDAVFEGEEKDKNLPFALEAYQKAENEEKVKLVADRQLENDEIARRFAEGLNATDKNDWVRAKDEFHWIVTRRPLYQRDGQLAANLLARAINEIQHPLPSWQVWLRHQLTAKNIVLFSFVFILAGSMGLGLVEIGVRGYGPLAMLATDTPTPTMTITLTPTETLPPSQTPTSTLTLTLTPSPSSTITPTPTLTSTSSPLPPPTVIVDEGSFTMGSNNWGDDQKPVHIVTLDTFFIDQYEVTNEYFSIFLSELGNQNEQGVYWYNSSSPTARILNTSTIIWQAQAPYKNHPVVDVTWYGAKAYCEWRGGELPTEAQWEKAARGPQGRTYPWGEVISCEKTNYFGCVMDTSPVGYFPNSSQYGVYDLIGNAWEWVEDWYDKDYYSNSDEWTNPNGPIDGTKKVIRGGSWNYSGIIFVPASFRLSSEPLRSANDIGFRCVYSP